MTDLSEVERKAFRRAFPPPFDDLGPAGLCTCDTYPKPIEDHGDECAVRALYEGWMAHREYSKQREEELKEALLFARGELHRALLERGSTDGYSASFGRINAALAENGETAPDGLGDRRSGA